MNYEKAFSLFRNDKTLQFLRADHFPLLVGFFHFAFKHHSRIAYPQNELQSLLGDYLYNLQQYEINDYNKPAQEYLSRWADQGYLRRYYETGDEPLYELSPATENALKWLEDLNKQEFVGTHSRLLQFFTLLQQIVNTTSGPAERLAQLEAQRDKIDQEIRQIDAGHFIQPSGTQIKENYLLAEETAKRLLSDFRQVEENFRQLDTKTRQTIVKSSLAKADLLDDVFRQQDHLWDTDQGKSFRAFWEFLMSEQMQGELDDLLSKINAIPAIQQMKNEHMVDGIKTSLVDAGDKVNRSNDGLIEQLRKFVEQKNLAESRYILQHIEQIENLILEHKDEVSTSDHLLEIDALFKPDLTMNRPLFSPPAKVAFEKAEIQDGVSQGNTDLLFEQFYVDIEVLRNNVRAGLKEQTQIGLSELLKTYKPTKGVSEILGYMQIAANDKRHIIHRERQEQLTIENSDNNKTYVMTAPVVIFSK